MLNPFQRGSILKEKKSFKIHFPLNERQNENDRVASQESVPIHLKLIFFLLLLGENKSTLMNFHLNEALRSDINIQKTVTTEVYLPHNQASIPPYLTLQKR